MNVTNSQTRWDKYHNDCRLEDRLIAIEKWKNELERVLANTDREINHLNDFKDNCDHALAAKAIPESVCAENIGLSIPKFTVSIPEVTVPKQIEYPLWNELLKLFFISYSR